jgi:hypothetical protein
MSLAYGMKTRPFMLANPNFITYEIGMDPPLPRAYAPSARHPLPGFFNLTHN